MEPSEYDIALTIAGSKHSPTGCYNLPRELYRALEAKGLFRATLKITEEGLLFVPYKAERGRSVRVTHIAKIPDWS